MGFVLRVHGVDNKSTRKFAMPNYWDDSSIFPMQGGCACGHLRYSLLLPPLIVHCCHCTACQRQLGSAFAINAIVESSALTILPSATYTNATVDSAVDSADVSQPCAVHPAFASTTGGTATQSASGTDSVIPSAVTVPTECQLGQTLVQCPDCHTTVWNYYADAGDKSAYLRVGTLDAPWKLDPDVHIFTRSRRAFVTIADGKPQFKGYYPDRTALYRPDTVDRVAALNVSAAQWKEHLKIKLSQKDTLSHNNKDL